MTKKLTQLEKALRDCQKASKQGYEDAYVILDELQTCIDSASASLSSTLKGLKSNHLKDKNPEDEIERQYKHIAKEFPALLQTAREGVDKKYRSTKSFTITLFGRTKAGKSTLREILTHGDGRTIGKGGQRTTRDFQVYPWNGMTIVDVPGIDAFGGEDDERIALEHALSADLIIFIITHGQPEPTEAEWLCRLKRMDKPILCVCNYKLTLDGHWMERFLKNPLKYMDSVDVGQAKSQFEEFVQKELPGEHINIQVVHLLARFLAEKTEDPQKHDALIGASQFPKLEKRIIDEVSSNASLYRKRCFLTTIDVPLFNEMEILFVYSDNNETRLQSIKEKKDGFKKWKSSRIKEKNTVISNIVDSAFRELNRQMPMFIENHLGDRKFGEEWNKLVIEYNVNDKVNEDLDKLFKKYKKKIEDTFSDLQKEIRYSPKDNLFQSTVSSKIGFDWNSTLNIGGKSLFGVGLCLWNNPVGWVMMGVGGISYIASKFILTNDKKKKEEWDRLYGILLKWMKDEKANKREQVKKWYSENITNGLFKEAMVRFNETESRLQRLVHRQRDLACQLAAKHCNITMKMVCNILEDLQMDQLKTDIIQIARIPGQRMLILTQTEKAFPVKEISKKMGVQEKIDVVQIRVLSYPEERLISLFKHYFKARIQPVLENDDTRIIARIPMKDYSMEEIQQMRLIQQITRIPIAFSHERTQD